MLIWLSNLSDCLQVEVGIGDWLFSIVWLARCRYSMHLLDTIVIYKSLWTYWWRLEPLRHTLNKFKMSDIFTTINNYSGSLEINHVSDFVSISFHKSSYPIVQAIGWKLRNIEIIFSEVFHLQSCVIIDFILQIKQVSF